MRKKEIAQCLRELSKYAKARIAMLILDRVDYTDKELLILVADAIEADCYDYNEAMLLAFARLEQEGIYFENT